MNREEHLLTIVSEECAEIAQRASKCARFGMYQIQKDIDDKPEENPGKLTNRRRMLLEYSHLIATMQLLGIYIDDIPEVLIMNKKDKIEKYLIRSKSLGTLNG